MLHLKQGEGGAWVQVGEGHCSFVGRSNVHSPDETWMANGSDHESEGLM